MASKFPDDHVVVYPTTYRDLQAISSLDLDIFEDHANTRKWYASRLLDEENTSCMAYIARRMGDRKAVGFCYLEMSGDTILIKKLGVGAIYRRMGIAKAILLQVIVEKPQFVDALVAVVPEEFLGAQLFFKYFGFMWKRTNENAFPKRENPAGYVMVWKESDYDLSKPSRSAEIS